MEWQPIEIAPKTGGRHLTTRDTGPTILLSEGNPTPSIGFWNGFSWDDGDWNHDLGDFTHWMPLPHPPST